MSVTVKPTGAPVIAPQKGNPLVRGLTSGGGASQVEALLAGSFVNLQDSYVKQENLGGDNTPKREDPQEKKSNMPMVNNRVAGVFHLNEVSSQDSFGPGFAMLPLDAITRGVGIYKNNIREIAADAGKD